MPVEEGGSVEETDAALEKAMGEVAPLLADGTITLDKIVQALTPSVEPVVQAEKLPVPRKITDALKAQIKKLPSVFGIVAPTEVRELQPVEVTQLLQEREVLDATVDELVKRKDDIRLVVLNHFDSQIRAKHCCEMSNDGLICFSEKGHDGDCNFEFVPLDKDGHFVPRAEGEKWTDAGESKTAKKFSWERRTNAKATLVKELLEELADNPEIDFISHDDYLAMTTQTRVLDEHKVMLAIKKNPKLLMAIAAATRPGSVSASLYTRKA